MPTSPAEEMAIDAKEQDQIRQIPNEESQHMETRAGMKRSVSKVWPVADDETIVSKVPRLG